MSAADDFREPHLRQGDFLGAFAVLRADDAILMVQNQRRIGGRLVATWDLPGGQVEPGEMLAEALRRELHEETGLTAGRAEFLFLQEGERRQGGRRRHAWRSFFFAVHDWQGVARPGGEVQAVRWVPAAELTALLVAPYHGSFRSWLAGGGQWFQAVWQD